jgi:hypothetical protein
MRKFKTKFEEQIGKQVSKIDRPMVPGLRDINAAQLHNREHPLFRQGQQGDPAEDHLPGGKRLLLPGRVAQHRPPAAAGGRGTGRAGDPARLGGRLHPPAEGAGPAQTTLVHDTQSLQILQTNVILHLFFCFLPFLNPSLQQKHRETDPKRAAPRIINRPV